MRVRHLRVNRYGALQDWHATDLPGGVTVIHGPNEAGKSTLFDLLTSLLYGFSPATGEKHPYHPWRDGGPLDVTADLVLQDGRELRVHRRLTKTPRGTLVRGEVAEDLGNRALPFVQHIGRDLYRALYALTAYDFRHLDDKHQAEIQDRLLGGFTTTQFRPVSAVLGELQREANQLWRTDRRQTKCSLLSAELRRVRQARQEAVRREAAIQSDAARLEELKNELDALRRERAGLQARVRRAETLAPAARTLRRLETWRREIGDEKRLAALPADLPGELQRLEDEAHARAAEVEAIEAAVREQEQAVAACGPAEEQVLARADDIREWVRLAELHDREQRELERAGGELQQRCGRLRERAAEVLCAPWSEAAAEGLKALPPAELKARILSHGRDQEKHRQIREARLHKEHNTPAVAPPVPAWAGAAGAAAGLVLTAVGRLGDVTALVAAGPALLVVALGLLVLSWQQRQTAGQLLDRHRREVEALLGQEREEAAAAAASGARLAELLAGIPVAPALLEHPDTDVYEALTGLRGEVLETEETSAQLAQRQAAWEAEQGRLAAVAGDLGEPLERGAGPAVDRLHARLEQAAKARENRDRARAQLEELHARQLEVTRRLAELRARRAGLEAEIRALAGVPAAEPDDGIGVPAAAVARVTALQETRQLLGHHERELQRQYADLPALREEIVALERDPEQAWVLDPAELELAKNRLEELSRRNEELYKEIVDLGREIETHRRGPSPGELDGEIQMLEEESAVLTRERDRLMLARMVLQRSDREFRERHAPPVLRRAGAYLNRITGRRYSHLLLLAAADGGERLMVQPAGAADPIPVAPPLSRGTLDQIFLAFRLAVIDHLDQDHEPLPLFLDEALINWDDLRLEHGIALLGDIAARRQVFVFTCHRTLAELLNERLGAAPLSLGLPDAAAAPRTDPSP
ncbi:MAG: AAA family ATPase [Candidatus Desulforudis sp.]|nr:AAA family ATPase [Desulforudis sp.]